MLAQGESAYSVRVKLQQQREADEALLVAEALAAERAAAEHVALDPARQLSAQLDAWQRGQTDALLAAHGLPARRDVAAPPVAASLCEMARQRWMSSCRPRAWSLRARRAR